LDKAKDCVKSLYASNTLTQNIYTLQPSRKQQMFTE